MFNLNLALFTFVGVSMLVLFTTAYLYYTNTQNTIATLRENNATLQSAVERSEETIEQLEEDAERNKQLRSELEINLQLAETYQDTLIGKLTDHDLTKLSTSRPGMIEQRINDATKEIFDSIESFTRTE